MILSNISAWSPFRIDALGLVTLIGADEANKAVGNLIQSRYTKFLPILGAYLIAGNQFTEMAPGYTLYNITDAIKTTAVSGWLTRWLTSQELKASTTVFRFTVSRVRKDGRFSCVISIAISATLLAALVSMTILTADWWGLSNSVSMLISIAVRWYMVRENYDGLDQAVVQACYGVEGSCSLQNTTLLVTLADGRMVTIYAPRGLVMQGFTKNLIVPHAQLYRLAKSLGWFAFGVHVLTLGQSALATQIFTVLLLVLSTWATCSGLGCDGSVVGNHIYAEKEETISLVDRRIWAFIQTCPSEEEEQTMLEWGLFPRRVNQKWWQEYDVWKSERQLRLETRSTTDESKVDLSSTSNSSRRSRFIDSLLNIWHS